MVDANQRADRAVARPLEKVQMGPDGSVSLGPAGAVAVSVPASGNRSRSPIPGGPAKRAKVPRDPPSGPGSGPAVGGGSQSDLRSFFLATRDDAVVKDLDL